MHQSLQLMHLSTVGVEFFCDYGHWVTESTGVAFVAPAPVMKPVSSVLEKIRQRRLQLGCRYFPVLLTRVCTWYTNAMVLLLLPRIERRGGLGVADYSDEMVTFWGCFSGSGTGSSQESETKSVSRRGRKEKGITHVDLTVDGDTDVEIEVFSSTVVKTEEVKTEETAVDVEVPSQEVSRVCSLNY